MQMTEGVKGPLHYYVGVSNSIGDRSNMEDEFYVPHFLFSQLDKEIALQPLVFSVFDGHSGNKASKYAKNNLSDRIFEKITKLQVEKNTKRKPFSAVNFQQEIQERIKQSFIEVDEEFCKQEIEEFNNKSSIISQSHFSGTTALSLVLYPTIGVGFAGNAGDCRAILNNLQETLVLTNEHRVKEASSPEIHRVISSGGWIEDGRLCGQLEPVRGIGDVDFKHLKETFHSNRFSEHLVLSEPEVNDFSFTFPLIERKLSYSFIVLATDGVWDFISNEEVVEFIKGRLELYKDHQKINADTIQSITDQLLQKIRSDTTVTNRLMDNTTIIIVCFVKCIDTTNYREENSSCLHCFNDVIIKETVLQNANLHPKPISRTNKSNTQQRRNKQKKNNNNKKKNTQQKKK